MEDKRPIIGVDFDGTVAQYTEWKGEDHCGDPIPGAIEFLRALSRSYRIVIFSARASGLKGKTAIFRWIRQHKLAGIITDVTHEKRYHFIAFIDDRAIPYHPENHTYSDILKVLNCGENT